MGPDGREDIRGVARAQMALAKSFIFHVVRACRICEKGASSLSVAKDERKRFLSSTATVLHVRDVNEHGFDLGGALRGKKSTPKLHHHVEEEAILDETSMVIIGDKNILMGPINLYDAYVATDQLRKIAGWRTAL